MSQNATKTQPSISAKLKQLETLTDWFYGDGFSLDEALSKYQAATELASELQQDLAELRNQVEVIHKDFTKA